MQFSRTLLMMAGIPAVGLATTLAPYAAQCALMDRLASIAAVSNERGTFALELLERVADGRALRREPEGEVKAGLESGQLQAVEFTAAAVRACALQKIGETGTPEATEYLSKLKLDDFSGDDTPQLWSAARIAFKIALL